MGSLVYSVRYSAVPINSSLLMVKFYSSVVKTLFNKHTKIFSPSHSVITEFGSICMWKMAGNL